MEQENNEGLEQEDADKIQKPESISEFITNMNFVHIKPFRPIPYEDIMTKYKNDVFWYVFDETKQTVISHPVKGEMEPVAYLFQEKGDAEMWRDMGSKSATHQDHKLSVEGKEFLSILEDVKKKLGEFKVSGISHAEAQNVFENYPEIRLSREIEEERNKNLLDDSDN